MASSRKKQDEKNLKTLRELGSLPQNKYCFDCNQRGPTYVNVTIGSFVCTKCSGMLRGLTPPHRVKSISMATFTTEEIELLKNRGNEYCKKIWLGLYDKQLVSCGEIRDEQIIKDFMIDKYEKKRYYLDPTQALKNGFTSSSTSSSLSSSSSSSSSTSQSYSSTTIQQKYSITNNEQNNKFKPLSALISDPKPIKLLNGNHQNSSTELRKRPEVNNKSNFIVNFDNVDMFSNNNNNNNVKNNINNNNINGINQNNKQEEFANFDDNPVFNNTNNLNGEFSIFDLKFTSSGPVLNQVPLFPKCNKNLTNRWCMPMAPNLDNFSIKSIGKPLTLPTMPQTIKPSTKAPSEDRYAALKDLDNALKSQNSVDWNSTNSNGGGGGGGSLYNSPSSTGSIYNGSPSPQNSMFGSPSQGFSVFQQDPVSNPFNNNANTNGIWSNQTFNPFRDPIKNGFNPNFQNFQPVNGQWAPNPFKVIGNGLNSTNNPFL